MRTNLHLIDKSRQFASGESIFLFDVTGELMAADTGIDRRLAAVPDGETSSPPMSLHELIGNERAAQVLAEAALQQTPSSSAITQEAVGRPFPQNVELRWLEGPAGPLILAVVRCSQMESPSAQDALTGLPDRRAIGPWVAALQRDGGRRGPAFAVLFLDLDNFKDVNDRHGHAAGDAVLIELTTRWLAAVRDGDLVSRYGGDEFVILLQHVADRNAAEPIVERLRQTTREPIDLAGATISITATIGVTVGDGDEPLESLLVAADQDLYARKRRRPK
jgi:diguanylate cyclase (GGDEF)-like protein